MRGSAWKHWNAMSHDVTFGIDIPSPDHQSVKYMPPTIRPLIIKKHDTTLTDKNKKYVGRKGYIQRSLQKISPLLSYLRVTISHLLHSLMILMEIR
mmetsp:Transcript_7389/g.8609  ORF Transcript_7389/g.8609 Transcript_7389/m.8609 type:complete len:96 (+) Transcript_7389:872-1159(+)